MQLVGEHGARQLNFVHQKGNYVHPLTHSLHFFCASWPKF